MLEERKFLVLGKTITIMQIVVFCLFLSLAIFVCVYNITAGMCMAAVILAITLYILWKLPGVIIFNDSYIQTKTFFGKIKKKMDWSDLKRIILKELRAGLSASDNYCIFIFTEEQIDFQFCEEAAQEDYVILMVYRKGLEEILKQYTKVDIENMIE